MFEPWQLAAIDQAGYNGIRDEHIEEVANSLLSENLTDVDRDIFEHHCRKCGIDPDNFTENDLEKLKKKIG